MEVKKVIYIILLIIWMITVFLFSSEKGETSGNTSGKVIKTILKIFRQDVSEENIKNLQLPIRKLAHFTLYAIGGILAIALLNQYNITIIQKIIYSQLILLIFLFQQLSQQLLELKPYLEHCYQQLHNEAHTS